MEYVTDTVSSLRAMNKQLTISRDGFQNQVAEMQTQMIRFAQEATILRAELGAVRERKAVVVRALRRQRTTPRARNKTSRKIIRRNPTKPRQTGRRKKLKARRQSGRR